MFRVIETFSGIGSQAKALTRIGKPFEIVNTADWDINAILAYCLIHKGKIDINKYADISDEDVTNFLKGLSLSSDGKKPMSDEAFRRMPMHLKRRLYAAIKETRNMVSITDVMGSDIPDNIDLFTYSFPCQDLSLCGCWHGNKSGIARDAHNRSGMLWEVERILLETATVTELYEQWDVMEFKEITEIVKSVLDGTMEETQVINLDVDGEKVSEYDVEQYLNFDDNTAALNKTVKSVIERTYSKKKVNMLKRLYAYRCQICGQNVGEEHGVNIAEAHHIKYFSKSVDNSSDNLLILCPNHHSLIHVLNPKFDYDELQYIYPDGKTDKIILDLHLTHGKEEE